MQVCVEVDLRYPWWPWPTVWMMIFASAMMNTYAIRTSAAGASSCRHALT